MNHDEELRAGMLVKVKELWKQRFLDDYNQGARRYGCSVATIKRLDKIALVVEDWVSGDDFRVIFVGETEPVDFNDEAAFVDDILEKVK